MFAKSICEPVLYYIVMCLLLLLLPRYRRRHVPDYRCLRPQAPALLARRCWFVRTLLPFLFPPLPLSDGSVVFVGRIGVMSTLCGGPDAGYVDGVGTAALFSAPAGIAVDNSDGGLALIVADAGNRRIRGIGIIPGYYAATPPLVSLVPRPFGANSFGGVLGGGGGMFTFDARRSISGGSRGRLHRVPFAILPPPVASLISSMHP